MQLYVFLSVLFLWSTTQKTFNRHKKIFRIYRGKNRFNDATEFAMLYILNIKKT